jgi:hypothetical protein
MESTLARATDFQAFATSPRLQLTAYQSAEHPSEHFNHDFSHLTLRTHDYLPGYVQMRPMSLPSGPNISIDVEKQT